MTQAAATTSSTAGMGLATTGTTAGSVNLGATGTSVPVSQPVFNPTMLPLDVRLRLFCSWHKRRASTTESVCRDQLNVS